ncbi:MAG TPA: YncE family protein [Chitinophagaceae bacterium]|nr:YncE family protein [Chitinophagaceae bacterium]
MIKSLFILSVMVMTITGAKAQKEFHLVNTFHIKSPGGWDYLAVGPGNNRLYVSHSTQVNILDLTTGDSIGIIENTTGVHGIAFDKDQNKGFTSNGRLNTVTVFDLITNKIITQIPTGQNPDAILFEPFSKMIITCNGRGKNLSRLDPVNNKLLDSVDVGGKPETAVSDGMGKLYVNVEDKNEIVAIDMKSFTVIAHWSILPAEEPTGLVLDKKSNRLFAGCGNKLLAVVNASTGKLQDSLKIGDGCDGVGFDSNNKYIFTSNGEGTMSVFQIKSTGQIENVGTITTKRGARTIAVDEKTHLIYLPTADFEQPDPNAAKGARPRMIPGSFQVLVFGQ